MHHSILHNDQLREAAECCLSPGQVGLVNGWGVFSTIRVIDGVMFAFERHWGRMERDAKLMLVPFPVEPAEIEDPLRRLIEANGATDAALRVMVVRNRGGFWEGPGIDREYDLIAFTSDVKRWGEGVRLDLVANARHAGSMFAGTKVLSWAQNLVYLERARRRGFDEVILLNEHGNVSECTSANVFIAEGGKIWTPPLSAGCLPGITRQVLLGEIRVEGISIGEKDLTPRDLERADEVFITSTTRGVLPVLAVNGLTIQRRDSSREPVQRTFAKYVRAYVEKARSKAQRRT